MKQLTESTIIDEIKDFIRSKECKLMLIWFPSNPTIDEFRRKIREIPGCANVSEANPLEGHSKYIDIEGQLKNITEEMRQKFYFPSSYSENTKFFLGHRYLQQLEDDFISYIKVLSKRTNIPVIYIVNSYSKRENPLFDASDFVEYEFV